jgi:cyclohexanone monooxygenase
MEVAVSSTQEMVAARAYDAVIVGAGFGGLYMLHKLRGLGYAARVYEAGGGVGGTWYWNRYPGARVDIESQQYSYSFSAELEEEWQWTERYASQPELERYINHVADRFDLRRDIQLETRVTSAEFDEKTNRWNVATDRGDRVSAKYCVMATGCLSAPKDIDLPGAAKFKGRTYHTSRWPHERVDFTGQKVAVVGTGSSGVQVIPQIAKEASHVTVFQRTPNFSLPARNCSLDPAIAEAWRANRENNRRRQRETDRGILADGEVMSGLDVSEEERQRIYEESWEKGGPGAILAFWDTLLSKEVNDKTAEFVRQKILDIVKDPAVAAKLLPTGHPIGAKRPCIDTDYFETFNRENVTLVDLQDTPIETLTSTGIRTSGDDYTVDSIVYAIGFDAMTGSLSRIDIRGRNGKALREKWANGPRTYLGLSVAGFPNLFLITGPGSPSSVSNVVVAIEQDVNWIADCMEFLAMRQAVSIEASEKAEADWVVHVKETADKTLFPLADSWYLGANVPGKPRVFMAYVGGFSVYREKCTEIAAKGYEGFVVTTSPEMADTDEVDDGPALVNGDL